MVEGKEKFEILLEEIRRDVKLSLEGHQVIRNEIKDFRSEINEKVDIIGSAGRYTSNKVNEIDKKLTEHICQPAHI